MNLMQVFTIAAGVALGMLAFVVGAAALAAGGLLIWFVMRLNKVVKWPE